MHILLMHTIDQMHPSPSHVLHFSPLRLLHLPHPPLLPQSEVTTESSSQIERLVYLTTVINPIRTFTILTLSTVSLFFLSTPDIRIISIVSPYYSHHFTLLTILA
jgi:hypothetical protein